MKTIDFEKEKPYFVNEIGLKWYYEKELQRRIENEQAENLPKLKGLGCFVVKGKDVEDIVLINNKQEVVCAFPYTFNGFEQMEARINIIKISKNYDDNE